MPHTWGQHHGCSRKAPEMSHKVSPLTTTCWSGAFGRKAQFVAAWAETAAQEAKRAAAAARIASDRATPVLKFFIGESVKCRIDTGATPPRPATTQEPDDSSTAQRIMKGRNSCLTESNSAEKSL